MQKNEFELNKKQLNLRIALTETIRGYVEERHISRDELKQVLDSLYLAFGDMNFVDTEINFTDLSKEQKELFLDDLQDIGFKDE